MAGLHLLRRGGVYWWRRRVPVAAQDLSRATEPVKAAFTTGRLTEGKHGSLSPGPTHLTVSLRTRCPREARRRATRLTAFSELVWSLIVERSESCPRTEAGLLASDLLATFNRTVEAYENIARAFPADTRARLAAEIRAEAELRENVLPSGGKPLRSGGTPSRSSDPAPVKPQPNEDVRNPRQTFNPAWRYLDDAEYEQAVDTWERETMAGLDARLREAVEREQVDANLQGGPAERAFSKPPTRSSGDEDRPASTLERVVSNAPMHGPGRESTARPSPSGIQPPDGETSSSAWNAPPLGPGAEGPPKQLTWKRGPTVETAAPRGVPTSGPGIRVAPAPLLDEAPGAIRRRPEAGTAPEPRQAPRMPASAEPQDTNSRACDPAAAASVWSLRTADFGSEAPAPVPEAINSAVRKANVTSFAPPRRSDAAERMTASQIFTRILDMQSDGYDIDDLDSPADEGAGRSFRRNSRKNVESTLRLYIRYFGDIVPDDTPEESIRDFMETVAKLPRNWGKSPDEVWSISKLVQKVDQKDEIQAELTRIRFEQAGESEGNIEIASARARTDRLAVATAVRHLRAVSRYFAIAVRLGWCERNPFEGRIWKKSEIKRRQKLQVARTRLPWGERLGALLATPKFVWPLEEPGDPLFWAPLISELAGLRMEEVLQLCVGDFLTESGVECIQVQITYQGQSLKSDAAARKVPLHQVLIELGLLKLVALRRQQGESRLFPHLKRGRSKETLSETFSKRYRTYRDSNGIYDERRDFHSHRAGFFSNLRNAGVPLDDRKLLMGHAETDMSNVHYNREGVSLTRLQEYVNRIEIDVSGIQRLFPEGGEKPRTGLRRVK